MARAQWRARSEQHDGQDDLSGQFLVSYVSQFMTLMAGDLIITGRRPASAWG